METPYTVAAYVLARVQAALTAAGRPIDADTGIAQVVAGGFIVEACEGGSLLVGVERAFRTVAPFPAEAGADSRCVGNPIAVDLVVGIYRCVQTMQEDGSAPPVEVQEAEHRAIYDDAAAVWNELAGAGILGVDTDDPGEQLYERAGISQIFPPMSGGIGGSETRVTLGVSWWNWCLT